MVSRIFVTNADSVQFLARILVSPSPCSPWQVMHPRVWYRVCPCCIKAEPLLEEELLLDELDEELEEELAEELEEELELELLDDEPGVPFEFSLPLEPHAVMHRMNSANTAVITVREIQAASFSILSDFLTDVFLVSLLSLVCAYRFGIYKIMANFCG